MLIHSIVLRSSGPLRSVRTTITFDKVLKVGRFFELGSSKSFLERFNDLDFGTKSVQSFDHFTF